MQGASETRAAQPLILFDINLNIQDVIFLSHPFQTRDVTMRYRTMQCLDGECDCANQNEKLRDCVCADAKHTGCLGGPENIEGDPQKTDFNASISDMWVSES
jgi:hypothetical protein